MVGSSSDPTASRIGGIMAVLRERHPYISVDLRARPSSGSLQGLKTGELDIGILLGKPVDPQLAYIALDSVPFRVAGPAAWKEQIERAVSPIARTAFSLVLAYNASGGGDPLVQAFVGAAGEAWPDAAASRAAA